MTGRALRWAGVVMALGILVTTGAGSALAQEQGTDLEMTAPGETQVGEVVDFQATLRDASGSPIQGAVVEFLSKAEFVGTRGEMVVGHATTDDVGVAVLSYEIRKEGPLTFIARFKGDGRYAPAAGQVELSSAEGPHLYHEAAGVAVPLVGKWLLVGLLGGVWSTYFAVMVILALIARDGQETAMRQSYG